MPARIRVAAVAATLTVAIAASTTTAPASSESPSLPPVSQQPDIRSSATGQARALPALTVRRVVRGLSQPWDVKQLPGGQLLITERVSKRILIREDGRLREVDYDQSRVWADGETGLMSIAVDPGFSDNRTFYTCHGANTASGDHDVRVTTWRLDAGFTAADPVRTLLSGIQATSGRHGGCRLLIGTRGEMIVGTGDAAVGTNAQDRRSLGGKVLRLNRRTGAPWPTNPFHDSANRNKRYVYTYGHRNVQGLALRSGGQLWSVEHGSSRDDEVNRLFPGGNYGWNPVPGYNESVPMTDHSLPGRQISAKWRSGSPTLATSGAMWVRGAGWGGYDGTLAVAALKASRVIFMRFAADGELRWTRAPESLRQFGRLRSVSRARNGDLLVTTAEGSNDSVLRVSP